MGNIRVLTDIVASQVAAGEVVERPASIVKELIENSLDARANRIELEFVQSGTALIRVSDDGIGMDREDALLCFERHATSKLRAESDLSAISTFGFRGEAIPSIASVSKLRIVTRSRESEVGTEVIVNGGRIEGIRESGEAYGTRVEVRSLFFNVPVRKKFLRGFQTEAGHMIHQLHCLALANPTVGFVGIRDGKKFLQIAPTEDLEVRVRDVIGEEGLAHLIKGESIKFAGIQLCGFLSRPGIGRLGRSEQFIFVNGRSIMASAISSPLREAYNTVLPKGHHPGAILFLNMDPSQVDCNVHPAKKEVRFREIAAVREAVARFACLALEKARRNVSVSNRVEHKILENPLEVQRCAHEEPLEKKVEAKAIPQFESSQNTGQVVQLKENKLPFEAKEKPQKNFVFSEQMEIQNLLKLEDMVVVGKIARRFAILESHFGMVVADMRAARERILFERLLNEMQQGGAISQPLLFPVVFDLPPRDAAWVAENMELLKQVGLLAEYFGGTSIKVEAVPISLNKMDISQFFIRLIDDLKSGGIRAGERVAEEAIARSVARFSGGEALPEELEQIQELLHELLRCELPYSCPRGKATMIPISLSELKRRFGS